MATPNHGYATLARGDLDWDTTLNDNFRDIDADAPIFDVESNLSNYIPQVGAVFAATDTGVWYIGDGASWSTFGEFGENTGFVDPAMDFTSTNDGFESLAESNRPLYSQDHSLVYIDPVNGGAYDAADGTQGDPYESVNDAAYHLAYSQQLHQFQIQLDNPGETYGSSEVQALPPVSTGYTDSFGPDQGRSFLLIGDPNNPTDYTFDATLKFHLGFKYSNNMLNAEFRGVYFKGGLNLDGQARFVDCHFGGRNDPGGASIKGYTGRAEFINCTFTSNADTVISTDHLKQCAFVNCTFDNTDWIHDISNRGSGPHFWDAPPTDSGGSDVAFYRSDSYRKGNPTINHVGGFEALGEDADKVVYT